MGMQPTFKVVPICESAEIADEILEVLQSAEASSKSRNVSQDTWAAIEPLHITLWLDAKQKYIEEVQSTANYRLESIGSNYRNRKRNLEQKIQDAVDDRIRRMHQSELQSATENYNARVAEINKKTSRADIHTTLIANGIIEIKRG